MWDKVTQKSRVRHLQLQDMRGAYNFACVFSPYALDLYTEVTCLVHWQVEAGLGSEIQDMRSMEIKCGRGL